MPDPQDAASVLLYALLLVDHLEEDVQFKFSSAKRMDVISMRTPLNCMPTGK